LSLANTPFLKTGVSLLSTTEVFNLRASILAVGKSVQTTFKVRQFRPADLERVIHINRTCLPENYSSFFFTDLYERFPATFLVAEENDQVVGYAMCRIERGIIGLKKKGHLISLAVLPEYQRRGIGYALMQEVMQAMFLYDATEIFLEVRVSNIPAINLYKKMGFRISQTERSYYANGEDAHIMSRKLPFTFEETAR